MRTKRGWLAVLLAFGLLAAACGDGDDEGAEPTAAGGGELPTLKIGVPLPFTGVVAESAEEMRQTFEMYVEEQGGTLGGLAANWLAGLVRGAAAKADVRNPDLMATIARVAVWAFAIVAALNQIGIARELVNTLFMATVGAVALAVGLAFGIGGRDTAAEVVRNWYDRSRGLGAKAGEAAEQLRRDVH